MAIVPYSEVILTQTARSSPVLAESAASKWFQNTLCSIREKELAVAHVNRTPDKDQPAAQLMRAALAHQKILLEEQRAIWRKLQPSEADFSVDDHVLEPVLGLESRSARALSDNVTPIGPHVQLEQGLKTWRPPWHATRPDVFATYPTAWQGLPTVLLRERSNASFWPRPPPNAWLFAGVVTSSAHLSALTTYASVHAIPILAIVGRALLQTEARGDCIEWPLPSDPKKSSASHSVDHMSERCLGASGCVTADLRLLTAGASGHPPFELPDWLRLWPMLFSDYSSPEDYSKWRTDCSSLRLQLARELYGRPAPPWWCPPSDGTIGQARAAGLWTKELSSQLRGAMPSSHAAQLYTSHFWQSGVLASSTHSCRAATAAAIVAPSLRPPCLSAADRIRLQGLAYSTPATT